MSDHWVFAGSDSYQYLQLADELRHDRRLALGPRPEPLQWYRRPLYPLFIAVVRGDARADESGGEGWRRIQIGQIVVELLVMWPLVFLVARKLGGPVAGLIALALATLYPPSVPFSVAALTESLSMTLAIASIAPLLLGRRRPRLWYCVGAGCVGLAGLLRPDGLLLGTAWMPAILVIRGWRERLRVVALSALVFSIVFGAWPIRNIAQFGRPHLTDGMIDRLGRDVPPYRGFWAWMQTWATDERAAGHPVSCFFDLGCDATPELFAELGSFDAAGTTSASERAEVAQLLRVRKTEGFCEPLSRGFAELARRRRAAHPGRVLFILPLRRAVSAWWAPQNELVVEFPPWPSMSRRWVPKLGALTRAFAIAVVIAGALLLLMRTTRWLGAILVVPVVARTAVLGWTAFALPRYVVPLYPLCYVMIAIAVILVARLPSARSPPSPSSCR